MVFSTSVLKETNNKSLFDKVDKKVYTENYSFFIETLNLLSEDRRIINRLFNESFNNSKSVVNEGIGGKVVGSILNRIDPKKIIRNIVDWFIKLLEKLWNNFNALLLNLFGQDRVISVYKNKLSSINIPIEFPEDRYIYTNLGMSVSYTTFKNELDKEFTNLIMDLSKFNQIRSSKDLFDEINNIKNNIDFSDSYFDEVRGNVLGSRDRIIESNFAEKLFNYFRNGGTPIPGGVIPPNSIKDIYNQYTQYSKNVKMIKKDKSDLQLAAKKLEKDFSDINLEKYCKDIYTNEAEKLFASIIQLKTKRIYKLCDLFTLVFSAKLDAVKEQYNSYQKILFTACKELAKAGL